MKILFLALAVVFWSCSGDSSTNPPDNPSDMTADEIKTALNGTWKLTWTQRYASGAPTDNSGLPWTFTDKITISEPDKAQFNGTLGTITIPFNEYDFRIYCEPETTKVDVSGRMIDTTHFEGRISIDKNNVYSYDFHAEKIK